MLKCYFLHLVVAAFLALVVAAVLLFLKEPTPAGQTEVSSSLVPSLFHCCCFAVAALCLLGFVVLAGFLVWVVFWGVDCCCCRRENNNAMHIEVLCCLIVECWNYSVQGFFFKEKTTTVTA